MKTVVMTGGTAGLGQAAARRIAQSPDTRLLLGARNTGATEFETLPLDLTRLASVRAFVQLLLDALGPTPIDSLVLNAGIQFCNLDQRTEDGFETTFAVNHLAHYLLARLLLPKLAQGGVLVMTTSDTHDPKVVPFAPKHLEPEQLARPTQKRNTGFVDGFRAYAASKLCDLLTARALASSREVVAKQLTVIAYNPGFTAGTSLFRAWPLWARIGVGCSRILRPFTRFATVDLAGASLTHLALGLAKPPPGRVYASLEKRRITWPDPSELAQRDDVMQLLWRDSAVMVGLPA